MRAYSPNIMANTLISCRTHNGKGEYLIYGNQRITWEAFASRVFKLSRALVRLGVKKNDKVAFMFHNTPAFIEVNYAVQIAGAIPTPMNYRYAPPEIEFQANHSDAKVIIYDSIWANTVEPATNNMSNVEHFICMGSTGLTKAVDYESLLNSGEDSDPQVANDFDDLAVMIYTGGTTGLPKGVMLTYQSNIDMWATLYSQIAIRFLTMELTKERHEVLLESLPFSGKKLLGPVFRTSGFKKFVKTQFTSNLIRKLFYKRLTDPDAAKRNYKHVTKAMYASMPFFHVSGYANLLLSALAGNFSYVMTESVTFDPETILTLIEKEKVSTLTNVPTGWKKLVSYKDFNKFEVGSVRMAGTGGGPCVKTLKKEIMEKFYNSMVVDTFGQTEMTPVTSFRLDADVENITDRSVGKSIVQTKIVGEDGKEMPQGEVGEILYYSNTIMKGYYKDEEKTNEAMSDGWFRSGDLGYIDENGEIRIVDRIKECINTGGEKVFPLEVEEIIQTHPNIDFACIIGVPDDEWGNTVRAVIQPANGEKINEGEIMDLCRSKLAGYKAPRSMVFVDELPFSPAGKLLRQKVKDTWGRP